MAHFYHTSACYACTVCNIILPIIPSICLSNAGIGYKQIDISSLLDTLAGHHCSFLNPLPLQNFNGNPIMGALNTGVGKNCDL